MQNLSLIDIKNALGECPKPPKIKEFAQRLNIQADDYRRFRRFIKDAINDGEIERLRGGRLAVPSYIGRLKGRLIVARGGFGFFIPEDQSEEIVRGKASMHLNPCRPIPAALHHRVKV